MPVCTPTPWRVVPNKAFQEHEKLTYSVRWGMVTAGKGSLAVEGIENLDSRPAYHISMDIHSSGLAGVFHGYRDRTDSWLDQASLTSLRTMHRVTEGNYKDEDTVSFDQACGRFHRHENRIDKQRIEESNGTIPSSALDLYGYVFYLRTLPLAVGQAYDVALYANDRIRLVSAVVKRRERVKVSAGRFECFLVEPAKQTGQGEGKLHNIQVWISADEHHLPVRIRMEARVGHIAADLTKVID